MASAGDPTRGTIRCSCCGERRPSADIVMQVQVDFHTRDVWVDPYVVQLGPQLPWGMPHRIEPGYWTTVHDSVVVAVLADGQRVPPANSSKLWTEGERVCVSCRDARVERVAAEKARVAAENERLAKLEARRLGERRLVAAEPSAPVRAPERRTPRSLGGLLASFVVVGALGALILGYAPVAIEHWLPDADGSSSGPLGNGEAPYLRLIVVAGALCGGLWLLSRTGLVAQPAREHSLSRRPRGMAQRACPLAARLDRVPQTECGLGLSPAGGESVESPGESAPTPLLAAPYQPSAAFSRSRYCQACGGLRVCVHRSQCRCMERAADHGLGARIRATFGPRAGGRTQSESRAPTGDASPGRVQQVVRIYQTPIGHRSLLEQPVETWSDTFESIGGARVRGGVVTNRLMRCGPCKAFVARGRTFGETDSRAPSGDAESMRDSLRAA